MSDAPNPPAKTKGPLKPILFGCLGLIVLFAIVAGIFSFWLMKNGKALVTDASSKVLIAVIEDSQIAGEQQDLLVSEVNRITNAFKDGRITLETMGDLAESLTSSPAFEGLIIQGFLSGELHSSGFDRESREAGFLTTHRFVRGYITEKISPETVDSVMALISTGSRTDIKDSLSDPELVAFLNAAEDAADNADITNAIEPIDYAAPIKAIVSRTLNE